MPDSTKEGILFLLARELAFKGSPGITEFFVFFDHICDLQTTPI